MKQYKYKNEKGEIENVQLEKWCWSVLYKDGTELHQFDKDGNFHRLAEINQREVVLFTMYKAERNGRYDIIMPENARIIHIYKNIHAHYFENFNKTVRIYMFGYRTGKDEKDFEYHYHFILPDDRMIISNKENIDLVRFELQRSGENN